MTFGAPFSRVLRPAFGPGLASGGHWYDGNGIVPAGNVIAAYQPKGAASYAASLVNLANPGTYDCVEGAGTVPWDATNGWKGDATNYLKTGVKPAGLGWTMIVRASNITYAGVYSFGGLDTTSGSYRHFHIGHPYWYPAWSYGNVNGAYWDQSPTSGVFALTATGGYANGSLAVSFSATNLVNTTLDVYILARNHAGTAAYKSGAKIQAFALYNVKLSDTQISAISTLMAAL